MFSLKDRKSNNPPLPTQLANEAAAPWEHIYTMPTSFQTVVKTKPKGPGRKVLLIILLVLLLALVAALVYWFTRDRLPAPTVPVTTPDNINTAASPPPTALIPPEVLTGTTASERDSTRYRDIRNLQTALELYKGEQKKYPIALLPLVLGLESTMILTTAGFTSEKQGSVYLDPVPGNPSGGGLDYLYESSDGTSYTITFSIEEGVAGLAAGEHRATPQGIDGLSEPPGGPIIPHAFTPPNLTIDTDLDGLTDAEELLFATDPTKPDSDGDGYLDGSEVDQDYDPAKTAEAKLRDSSSFTTFTNDNFDYTIRYPVTWLAKAVDSEGSEVIFSAGGDEFIEVLVVDNPEHLDAAAWYAKQIGNLRAEEVPTVTYGNVVWVISLDGLNAYLASDRGLVTVSYNIGTRVEASYYHLFQTMVKSFILLR